MCAKLRTMAASNNRPHAPRSLYLLLLVRATYIRVLFFAHIPFVVNRAFSATPTERLQQHPLFFTTKRTDRTFFLWRFHILITAPLCWRVSLCNHASSIGESDSLCPMKGREGVTQARGCLRHEAGRNLRGDTVQFIAPDSCVQGLPLADWTCCFQSGSAP